MAQLVQKIVIADLSSMSANTEEYEFANTSDYGRGLAVRLLWEHTTIDADRLDPENPIVFVPGLFVSSSAPSSCRMHVVSKRGKGEGAHISNVTGDTPHRLASSGISALVIKGKAEQPGTVLYIEDGKMEFIVMPELPGLTIPDIIENLRQRFGEGCALMGTGPSADACLPLSTIFVSYPKGIPPYGCPRNTFGDVAGSKNLKAIVVKNKTMFTTTYYNKENFSKLSVRLSKIIRSNNICGGALPGYGSIAIMKLLKNKADIPAPKKLEKPLKTHTPEGIKINRNCSPICVIGCLNRGEREALIDGFQDVPEVSEVDGALNNCFGIKDNYLVQQIMSTAFRIGFNATEFVYTAKLYFEAIHETIEEHNAGKIHDLLLEVEKLTLTGRVIGGGTNSLYKLYKDSPTLKALVSKPSISQEKDFIVDIERPEGLAENILDMDLLYFEIFLLENLGFCIFTSFAVLNNEEALEIITKMFFNKTGLDLGILGLLEYSKKCIDRELAFHKQNATNEVGMSVPEFTKVLYRYFGTQKS